MNHNLDMVLTVHIVVRSLVCTIQPLSPTIWQEPSELSWVEFPQQFPVRQGIVQGSWCELYAELKT